MTHVVAVVLLPLGTGETARLNALRATVGAGLPVVLAGRGRDRRLTQARRISKASERGLSARKHS